MSGTAIQAAGKRVTLARGEPDYAGLLPLHHITRATWDGLVHAAVEPNAFYAPDYALPVSRFCAAGKSLRALTAQDETRKPIGMIPVLSAWEALRLPLPALVAQPPFSPLSVPLLCRADAPKAAGALIDAAAAHGARVLSLPHMTLDGPAYAAFAAAMSERSIVPTVHNQHQRAAMDAQPDAETYLRQGMGSKRLKDMRRLRNRLDEEGVVAFVLTSKPDLVGKALERFLVLEAGGWKGAGGTGLGQNPRTAAFVRAAANEGSFEIAELTLSGRTIASGIIMRHAERAFFFKIAYDEALSRFSPGVQLTLELTRMFAADPSIRLVDSTADAGHPMIDYVWRERLVLGDLLIPTRPNDPAATAIIALMAARRQTRSQLRGLLRRFKTKKENRT